MTEQNTKKIYFVIISLLITVFVFYLGIWQTSRHFEKKAIIEDYTNKIQITEQKLDNINDINTSDTQYRIFQTQAKFIPDSQIYLGPKQVGKTVGYNIIGLFETKAKQNIIVNLGFIPLAQKDNFTINTAFQDLTIMQRNFTPKRSIFIPENEPNSSKWFYLDQDSMEKHYNVKLSGFYFRLLSNNFADQIQPFDKNDVDFFNEHKNYAITWFSLALILGLMIIIYARIEKIRFFK